MRLLTFIFLLICSASFGQNTKKYLINGQIKSFQDKMVYLVKGKSVSKEKNKWKIIDSIYSKKGEFKFKGLVPEVNFYSVITDEMKYFNFILENGNTVILKGNQISDTKLEGSINNTLHEDFVEKNRTDKQLILLENKLNIAYDSAMYYENKGDSIKYEYFAQENISINKILIDVNKQFIKNNPKAFYSLVLVQLHLKTISETETLSYLEQLPKELKNHSIAKEIRENKTLKSSKKAFYYFQFFDMNNQKIDFTKYEGKYILIDFWASWCKPCIANLPKIIEIDTNFKNDNFATISVAIETNTETWANGFKKHPFTWLNISDLKGFNGLLEQYYNINAIPRYMILDPKGYALYDNIKLGEIEDILKKILKK